jgi:hypothetical protein
VVGLLVIDEVVVMPGHRSAATRLDILDGRSIHEGVEVLKVLMNNMCEVFAVLRLCTSSFSTKEDIVFMLINDLVEGGDICIFPSATACYNCCTSIYLFYS